MLSVSAGGQQVSERWVNSPQSIDCCFDHVETRAHIVHLVHIGNSWWRAAGEVQMRQHELGPATVGAHQRAQQGRIRKQKFETKQLEELKEEKALTDSHKGLKSHLTS